MKIFIEQSLRDFNFWSGGKDRADQLTGEQLDQVEEILEELYPDGVDETTINDLFWFDFDTIKEWLGLQVTLESVEDIIDDFNLTLSNGVEVELSCGEDRYGQIWIEGEFSYTDEDGEETSETESWTLDPSEYDTAEELIEAALRNIRPNIERYFE